MILLKNLLKCDVAHQFFQPMLYPQKRSEFFISDHLLLFMGLDCLIRLSWIIKQDLSTEEENQDIF